MARTASAETKKIREVLDSLRALDLHEATPASLATTLKKKGLDIDSDQLLRSRVANELSRARKRRPMPLPPPKYPVESSPPSSLADSVKLLDATKVCVGDEYEGDIEEAERVLKRFDGLAQQYGGWDGLFEGLAALKRLRET